MQVWALVEESPSQFGQRNEIRIKDRRRWNEEGCDAFSNEDATAPKGIIHLTPTYIREWKNK